MFLLMYVYLFQKPFETEMLKLDELYVQNINESAQVGNKVMISFSHGIKYQLAMVDMETADVKVVRDDRWYFYSLPSLITLDGKVALFSHLQEKPDSFFLDEESIIGERLSIHEFAGWKEGFKLSHVENAVGSKAWCLLVEKETDRAFAGLIDFNKKEIDLRFSRPYDKNITTYWVQLGDSLLQITHQTAEVIEVDPRSGKTLRVLKPAEELRERKRKMRRRYVPKFFASTKTGDTYYLRYLFEDPSLPEEERYSHKTVRVREDGIEITDDPRFVLGEHEGNKLVFDFLEQELMLVPSS